jgi:hypothetical protein
MRNTCATATNFLFRFLAFFGAKWPERFWLQKSCYMILESGYYLHHKNLAILYSFDYYKVKSMVNYCIIVP